MLLGFLSNLATHSGVQPPFLYTLVNVLLTKLSQVKTHCDFNNNNKPCAIIKPHFSICLYFHELSHWKSTLLPLYPLLQQESDCMFFVYLFRLLENLPLCNLDILKELCSCLHEISQNASMNMMNASELAVSITPSIFYLWEATSINSSLEMELLKKVMMWPIPIVISQSLQMKGAMYPSWMPGSFILY